MNAALSFHPDHLADLAKSGLTEDDARAAGIYSARPGDIPRLVGRDMPDGTSALVFPYHGCDGFVRVKLFPPLVSADGSATRYLQRVRAVCRLYIPPSVAPLLAEPAHPLAITEGEKLLQMRENIAGKIIGQDDAVDMISRSIRRTRTGLRNPNRPIGSFIFLGPPGVGKTELAKVLAEYLFQDKQSLVRIDMSEYMEKFNVSRLIGAPPGYVGYDEGGQLTERVRRRPYSVVLLDEIEKAHPDVFNILLQVLDAGELTDGSGRKVDFKNTILIMTSNLGTREATQAATYGFSKDVKGPNQKEIASKMREAVFRLFRPEFLNRVDEIIVFRLLERQDVLRILEIYVSEINQRLQDYGLKLDLTRGAKDYIMQEGFSAETGARTLRRSVERLIEDPVAEEILRGRFPAGSQIQVSRKAKGLTFAVHGAAPAHDKPVT